MKSLMMERYPLRYGNLILERNDFLMVKKYLQGGPGLEEYTHDNVLALLRDKISVLSSLGCSVMGLSKGDII